VLAPAKQQVPRRCAPRNDKKSRAVEKLETNLAACILNGRQRNLAELRSADGRLG
jgi:hypothetical protein